MSFRTVQPRIGEYGQSSPEAMADVLTFVLLTIQQPLESIPVAFADVRKRGSKSKWLFGIKREGYEYVTDAKREIFRDLRELDTLGRLAYLANLPGFGLPKAGFAMQLLYGEVGCIDTHNLERFGLKPGARFRIKGQRPETQAKKTLEYVKLCEDCGGVEALWDEWCAYVASLRPRKFRSALDVSNLHAFYLER